MQALFDQLRAYLGSGGVVMAPLLGVGFFLWFSLALRFSLLRRGLRGPLGTALADVIGGGSGPRGEGVVARALRRASACLRPPRPDTQLALELLFKQERSTLRRFRRPVRVLAAVAPLLGLLGTVIGMIETFAALTDRQLFAQSGGVAGGISMALLTTQLGLLVAIPGLFAGRLLDRREARLRGELERLDHLLQLHLARRAKRAAGPAALEVAR